MKLYFGDLPCYQNLTLDVMLRPSYEPDASFDLSRMPNESLRQAFAAFIFDRASSLSYSSLRSEATHFHNFAHFISDVYPDLQSITDIPFNDMEKELKKYLIKQGKPLVTNKKKRDRKLQGSQRHPDLLYLRTVYDYFLPDDPKDFDKDRDIWRLESMPFMLRASPIGCDTRVNFTKIRQDEIKHEVKEGALYHLKRLAVRTVIQEVTAINNLSEFLDKNYPDIKSLKDFNRALLEEYLSYLYLECDRRKDYRGELSNLKSLLNIIGKLLGYDNLRGIFLKSDFQKHKRTIYKSYSDEDIKALHLGYKLLDKQTARLLLIHELLGLRISDTMTIKIEDVFLGDAPYVRISQSKTGNGYNKKLNAELAALFRACIEETTEKYGSCEYIFVSDKDPTKPMKYTTLRYRLSSMINTLDLRDSNGNPLTPSTHLFRHTYGKKLCDLLNDDATIAALLGHKSISSVAYYRQMSPKVLAESTKPVIDARNEKDKEIQERMDGIMNNYDNMLLSNRKVSEEKKILAIDTIRRMVKANEHISIVELTKLTGLSRSFFYKNEQVNAELMKALKSQEGKVLTSRRDKTLNEALKETVRLQKEEIDRLRMEKSQLAFALKRLQDKKQNDVDFALIEKL